MRVASFDIGYKNFAFCIEEFDSSFLKEMAVPSCINKNGTLGEEFGAVVERACLNGKTLLHRNIDLTKGKMMKTLEQSLFHAMTTVLEEYEHEWENCDAFIVEMQMSFKGVYNVKALKLGQHCLSYFYINHRHKEVVEWPAYHKTEVLGLPKKETIRKKKDGTETLSYKSVTKPQRKKWTVNKVCEFLEKRNENDVLKNLTTAKKKDDLADTLALIWSWKIISFCCL